MDPNPSIRGHTQQQPPPRASHLSAALRLQEEQQQRFHPQAHQVGQVYEAGEAKLNQFIFGRVHV